MKLIYARLVKRLPQLQGFPPIANAAATALILGSMPSVASLAAAEYYAHPRNAFWPIMAALCSFEASAPYRVRIAALKKSRIALWDVIGTCRRPGSLDAQIDPTSLIPNNFAGFFAEYPRIERVFFNGAKAESCFRRFVLPTLRKPTLRFIRLPSTSPAHASLSIVEKIKAWQVAGLIPSANH